MVKEKLVCSSCNKNVASAKGTTKFSCPNCGKLEIIRCTHCRKIAAKYACADCGFEGPN